MEYDNDDRLCFTMEEFFLASENGCSTERMERKRNYDDDTREYKSKNLEIERRRREKLSRRLLMLRSINPIITNMNRGTIIVDAITYIERLQQDVQSLSQELHQMEATPKEIAKLKMDEIDAAEEMMSWGIQEEVRVAQINENKLWVKIIIEKKRGRFSKLIEALNNFGIELIDTNLTTTKGAFLITSCIQGKDAKRLEIHQLKNLLQDIIKDI